VFRVEKNDLRGTLEADFDEIVAARFEEIDGVWGELKTLVLDSVGEPLVMDAAKVGGGLGVHVVIDNG